MKFFDFLKGKRTYIFAGLGAIVVFCYWMTWIDYIIAEQLVAMLGFGGLAALRAGIK